MNRRHTQCPSCWQSGGLTPDLKAKSIEISTEIIKDGKTLQGISRFKAVELDTPVQMIENLLSSSLAFYTRIEEGQLAVKIQFVGDQSISMDLLISLDPGGGSW
jgi:hypothetical protein